MQTINKWLEAIGMGRYAKNFLAQGFATPRQILLFTEKDLDRLGVSLEHQRKMLKAIQNTRAQVGFLYQIHDLEKRISRHEILSPCKQNYRLLTYRYLITFKAIFSSRKDRFLGSQLLIRTQEYLFHQG